MDDRSAGSRHPVILAVSFLLGILLVLHLPSPLSLWWTILFLPVAAAAPRAARLPFTVGAIGFVWAAYHAHLVVTRWLPESLEKIDLVVEGRVRSLPEERGRYLKFDFDVERRPGSGGGSESGPRIRLRAYAPYPAIAAGERWRLVVRLTRPHGALNPGGFDYEKALFRAGIGATGYVRADARNRRLAPADEVWLPLRASITSTVDQALGFRSARPVIRALAIGDRSGFTPQHWEVLRRTGTAHLVAISGLHIGLVAGIGWWLGQRFWRYTGNGPLRLAAPRFGALVGVAAAVVYAALAGFAIPTQRALIMLSVVAVALYCGRSVSPFRLLAVALLAVLIYDPLAVLDVGLWLSFGAVLALALAFNARVTGVRRVGTWLTAQFTIAVGLLPLVALLFGEASLVGPLANSVAIPIVGLAVVPLTLGSLALHALFPTAGAAGLLLAAYLFDALWAGLVFLSRFDLAALTLPPPSVVEFGIACIGALWWVAARGVPGRWLGVLGLVPMLTTTSGPDLARGEYELVVLDVGQGLAVVVHTRHSTLVYDTGAAWDGNDAGKAVVIPYLRHRGIARLDTLVVSHGDTDHIGGASSVLRHYRAARILTSVPHRFAAAEPCRSGQRWEVDGVEFRVLGPHPEDPLAGNDASCVLRIAGHFGSVLLTGDIEAAAERRLLQRDADGLRSDVLLVPHQGSKTSSTPAFLRAVAPHVALVSAGYRNRYGHPHAEVLARYRRLAIPVHNTAHSGALRLAVTRTGGAIRGQRDARPRLWHTHRRRPDNA